MKRGCFPIAVLVCVRWQICVHAHLRPRAHGPRQHFLCYVVCKTRSIAIVLLYDDIMASGENIFVRIFVLMLMVLVSIFFVIARSAVSMLLTRLRLSR